MKTDRSRLSVLTALLPVFVSGCATQGVQSNANVEAVNPAASAPQAAAVAPHAARPTQPLPPPSALETEAGLQITQVGLTASGGLVDVRFRVLDAAKAKALLGNPANTPMLIAGDNPPLVPPHHALKGARFAKGHVFYILYPNQRNAIKPGVQVTVAMGDARLGPVTAQ